MGIKRAYVEYAVLALLAIVLLAGIVPSLKHARREARDGMRRDGVSATKTRLEQVNNELGYYPVDFDASPYQFGVVEREGDKALGWYIRTMLENDTADTAGFDYEKDRNYYFRVVHEDGVPYFDACGGTFSCNAPPRKYE